MTFYDQHPPIAIGALVVSLASHGLALLIYRFWVWDVALFGGFRQVIAFLLTLSAGLSVVAFLMTRSVFFRVVLGLRIVVVLVLVYSFGINVYVVLPLLIGLLYEVNVYESLPINAFTATAIMVAAVLLHRAGALALSFTHPRYVPDVVIAGACLICVRFLSRHLLSRPTDSDTDESVQTRFGGNRIDENSIRICTDRQHRPGAFGSGRAQPNHSGDP